MKKCFLGRKTKYKAKYFDLQKFESDKKVNNFVLFLAANGSPPSQAVKIWNLLLAALSFVLFTRWIM